MKPMILTAMAWAVGLAGVGWAANQPVPATAVAEVVAGPRPVSDDPAPKTAQRLTLRYLPCPSGSAECRVILSWRRHPQFVPATDTAVVTWYQVTPSVSRLDSTRVSGTADTIMITRPAAGQSKAGTARLCHVRAGYTGGPVCNSPMAWSVEAEALPTPLAQGVSVRRAGGDTLWVKYTVAATGADTIRARTTFTSFTKSAIDRKYPGASKTDSTRVLLGAQAAPTDRRYAGQVIPSASFGTTLTPGSAAAWSWLEPITPPDTAIDLQVTGIYVKPDTVRIGKAEWEAKGIYASNAAGDLFRKDGTKLPFNCPAGGAKCPQQQFCAYSKMSDNKVYMTDGQSTIEYCQTIFATFPNRAPTLQPASIKSPEKILVQIGPLAGQDTTSETRVIQFVKYGNQRLMQVSTGEWIRMDFMPLALAE